MADECLICKSKIEYLDKEIEMECFICHKRELSKTRCVNRHYVCDECHTEGIDQVFDLCINEKSKDPIYILNKMMSMPFCHMHGPEHHILVGEALLTAYKNAGGEVDFVSSLKEIRSRGKKVPGGICGFWGACGAAISSGIFISVISKSNPLEIEPFALSNKMTSRSLEQIGNIGGPRCCKRDSYLSILQAIDFVEENFGIKMDKENVTCNFHQFNNQCIGKRCPFFSN
ncbi:MAG: DUF5714 domain-containing protein [Tissierellia bacterium]|nr:DUF5714 domain-containing protein [Tissierellia bacterium]